VAEYHVVIGLILHASRITLRHTDIMSGFDSVIPLLITLPHE
jgi:hypothetical protein